MKTKRPFKVMEAAVQGGDHINLVGEFETYVAACDHVDTLPKERIPFCTVIEEKDPDKYKPLYSMFAESDR